MKIKWILLVLFFINVAVSAHRDKTLQRQKRHHDEHDNSDVDLRRTKRNIYQALMKKKEKSKRSANEGIDINERNLIKKPNIKYRKEQVQDVRTRIEVIHEWREAMLNHTSPEYELLAGNIIDAVANEFTADTSYISAAVSKLTKTKSLRKIIADVSYRFFKSEDDPSARIQGVISKGWISGQQVDPNYFKLLGITNGNHEKPLWQYPEGVELRVIPVQATNNKQSTPNQTATTKHTEPIKQKPLTYKEIQLSIKLKQRYEMFLDDNRSPEFAELSGNLEQAIMKIFANDRLFIDTKVISFKESEESRVIATLAIQFNDAEKYAIEKSQAMISSGDLVGMPVDELYFVVDKINEVGSAESPQQTSTPEHLPQPVAAVKTSKPKPLRFKEVRASIKFMERWNSSFADNNTASYAFFTGFVEQAVDRGFSDDPKYIDATVIDLLEGDGETTIGNIAIRFHLEEEDPEGRIRILIKDGDLSGLKVDNSFFYVFTLSETTHPGPAGQPTDVVIESSPILVSTNLQESNQTKPIDQVQELRPSVIGIDNSTEPNPPKEQPTQTSPVTTKQPTTFNPYLPTEQTNHTANETTQSYLNAGEGTVSQVPKGNNIYDYPYAENTQQSWYQYNQQPTPTVNPYLPVENNETNVNTTDNAITYNPYLPQTTVTPVTNEGNNNSSEKSAGNNSSEKTAGNEETPTGNGSSEDIEGTMTLEQTWHPYLSDKSSQVYRVLEQTVVTAIKNVYADINEDVVPEILGFGETDIPTNVVGVSEEKKVAVRFRVSFLKNHKASAKPLEDAVASNSVAGILIFQNSLVIAAANSQKNENGLTTETKQLTICQKQQKYAESETKGPIGGFVPQCKENGGYKSVQCHALTGFCWCVNKVGVRITGTEERYKQPKCDQIKIKGNVMLPLDSPDTFPAGSCLTVYILEKIECNKTFVDCQMPVIANQTFTQLPNNSFELPVKKFQTSGVYLVASIFNVGWCSSEMELSKDSVHDGDFMTNTPQEIVFKDERKVIEVDVNLELAKMENTITLWGSILLPQNTPSTLPPGSCLTVFVQPLILCQASAIDCHVPILANHTSRNIEVFNNTILYELTTTKLQPGHYVMNAVVNIGWCRVNSIKSSEQIRAGDLHTTELHDFVVEKGVKDVNKDVSVEIMNAEETGIRLHGTIHLPEDNQLTNIPQGSCLSIQTKALNLCTGPKCPLSPPSAMELIYDIEINNNQIPYSVNLPELEPGTYVISAVLHVGTCPQKDQSMKTGDYYNEQMYDYTVASETTDVEKDIELIKLNNDDTNGAVVYGTVEIPQTLTLPPGSCLSVSSRKLIQCRNNNCKIPPVSTKTFENVTNDGGVVYTLNLPAADPGRYIISAVINLGWCKVEDGTEWIRPGDYYNDKIHDYEIKNGSNAVERNITVQPFESGEEKTGVTVHGRVILPENADKKFPVNSCITIKAQEYRPCEGGLINCVNPISAKETYHEPQLENNVIPYALVLPNVAVGHYIISAVLNVGWCKDQHHEASDDWIHDGDYHNDEIHDFIINDHTQEVEVDINVNKYIDTFTGPPQKLDGTEHIESIDKLLDTTTQPLTQSYKNAGNDASLTPTTKPLQTTKPDQSETSKTENVLPTTPKTKLEVVVVTPTKPISLPAVQITSTPAVQITSTPATSLPAVQITSTPATFAVVDTTKSVETTPFVQDLTKETTPTETVPRPTNLQTGTPITGTPIQTTSIPEQTATTVPIVVDKMKENTTIPLNNNTDLSPEVVELPAGLPKSCQEIRAAGIGNQDGQYIIEARHGCHISIICQGMDGGHPKEFLGGPSEDEWKYWHYAVLIKISDHDKQNIPSGACLEHSENGRDLLKRILVAGAEQGNPISEWKTNIANLLRSKRNLPEGKSIMTKAKTIFKGSKTKRQNLVQESEWGVL